MSNWSWAGVALAALLLFWGIGAYNRIMRLRNKIGEAYAQLDQHLSLRSRLISQLMDLLRPELVMEQATFDALQSAQADCDGAASAVRARPAAADPAAQLAVSAAVLDATTLLPPFHRRLACWALQRRAGCATTPFPSKARVVVIGGGYGGATAAKYVRLLSDHKIDVVLIEPNDAFVSCPLSNLVLGGSKQLADITTPYAGLLAQPRRDAGEGLGRRRSTPAARP
jgi:hypothetical protein